MLASYIRLRPHFFAVCAPDWSRVNGSGYIEDDICTGSDRALITEARFVIHSDQVLLKGTPSDDAALLENTEKACAF